MFLQGLFGITMRNSIMMVSHFDHLTTNEEMTWGRAAVLHGASERLLPILMTATVTALGVLPLALGSDKPGREIEGPMGIIIPGRLGHVDRAQSARAPEFGSSIRPVRGDALARMNITLLKALIALVPTSVRLSASAVLFFRGNTVNSLLQLLGAGFLVMVGFTHVCEALQLVPWMHWGSAHSVGHYLDVISAVLGLTLFPVGYVLHAITK